MDGKRFEKDGYEFSKRVVVNLASGINPEKLISSFSLFLSELWRPDEVSFEYEYSGPDSVTFFAKPHDNIRLVVEVALQLDLVDSFEVHVMKREGLELETYDSMLIMEMEKLVKMVVGVAKLEPETAMKIWQFVCDELPSVLNPTGASLMGLPWAIRNKSQVQMVYGEFMDDQAEKSGPPTCVIEFGGIEYFWPLEVPNDKLRCFTEDEAGAIVKLLMPLLDQQPS